ncbi:MAG: flavin prenyltransferase UbiX [Actinomycetota bacterium]|nr:flavin prenyltransferase UbiX [Actinomycetota bacterium]
MRIVVGITGASGSVYAEKLLKELTRGGHEVKLILTEAAKYVINLEIGLDLAGDFEAIENSLKMWVGGNASDLLEYIEIDDIASKISSGSYPTHAMVVIPCSMGTLASIRAGISKNILERAADVTLKEGRPLILVPRETPLSELHLENMLTLKRAGATILPAMPGFYNRPDSIDDLVSFIVGRLLDLLGIAHHLYKRWEG